jgi:hypothetical protein
MLASGRLAAGAAPAASDPLSDDRPARSDGPGDLAIIHAIVVPVGQPAYSSARGRKEEAVETDFSAAHRVRHSITQAQRGDCRCSALCQRRTCCKWFPCVRLNQRAICSTALVVITRHSAINEVPVWLQDTPLPNSEHSLFRWTFNRTRYFRVLHKSTDHPSCRSS